MYSMIGRLMSIGLRSIFHTSQALTLMLLLGAADRHGLPAEADPAAAAGPPGRPLPERPAVDAERTARVRVQETMAVPRCKHGLGGLIGYQTFEWQESFETVHSKRSTFAGSLDKVFLTIILFTYQ